MMNTYDLPVRPLYNIPALTLHECEPGHSFQAALAAEQKALPALPPQPLLLGLWARAGGSTASGSATSWASTARLTRSSAS